MATNDSGDTGVESKDTRSTRSLRGKVILNDLAKRKARGVKELVQFNSRGQPFGRVSSEMRSYIGCLARQEVEISYKSWKDVPREVKNTIWEYVNIFPSLNLPPIVPCNVGNHWILTIIDPHKEMVSLVDPLSHRNRDNSWKEVVNKAITMFNAKIGRRGKKQPNWEIIKAPLQPDSKQCGFFVMRYMREIIDELANNGSISLKSHFEHRRYSQEEIDEVRIEWANCVLEQI